MEACFEGKNGDVLQIIIEGGCGFDLTKTSKKSNYDKHIAMIHCVFFAIVCILFLSLYCFSDKIKQQCDVPFGGMYVPALAFYMGVCLSYQMLYVGVDDKHMLELATLCLGFVALPAFFVGMKKRCFGAAVIAIFGFLLALTAWVYVSGGSLLILGIPLLVCLLMVYVMAGYKPFENDIPLEEDDLLNRVKEYDDLLEEIRCLASSKFADASLCQSDSKTEKGETSDVNGMNIALCSPWGSGKSHFFNYLHCHIVEENNKSKGWKHGFVVKRIEVWKMEKEAELWAATSRALLSAIMGDMHVETQLVEKTLFQSIVGLSGDGAVVNSIYKLIYKKEDGFSLSNIKTKNTGKRILLIFEDLERARTEIIEALLPLLDRVRKLHNVFTICSVDKEELELRIVKTCYERAQGYLAKIFDRCIYLSPVKRENMHKLLEHQMQSKAQGLLLVPTFFEKFPHPFDTPRKLIRVVDALEGMERLYFKDLSHIVNFSLDYIDKSDEILRLFIICEVELLRTLNPQFLSQIVKNGKLSELLNKLPVDETANLLKEVYDISISYETVSPNLIFYSALENGLKEKYGEIVELAFNESASLNALSYMHKYRTRGSLDASFDYAYHRVYMTDEMFVPLLKNSLLKIATEEKAEAEQVKKDESKNGEQEKPKESQSNELSEKFLFGNYIVTKYDEIVGLADDALHTLRMRNSGYPYSTQILTNYTSGDFVRLLVSCFQQRGLQQGKRILPSQTCDSFLLEIFKTMRIAEQSHVLKPAFNLRKNPSNGLGINGKFSNVLREYPQLEKLLKSLCKAFAQHMTEYALCQGGRMSEDSAKETFYDYFFHPYAEPDAEDYIDSFERGIDSALRKYSGPAFETIASFTSFVGLQFYSTRYFHDVKSSFATPQSAKMLLYLGKKVSRRISPKNISSVQRRKLSSIFRQSISTLIDDMASWEKLPDRTAEQDGYITGISLLLEMLTDMETRYVW